MTSVIPRSSHASIVTGSTLDPFNQDNHHRYSASIGTSYDHSRNHSRAVSQSNPFEVIYSSQDLTFDTSTAQPNLTVPRQVPSARNFRQHSPWHSQSNYDLIAENIETGRSPISEIANNSSSSNNNTHPVVTVVGSPALNRSGSTISRLATLRNRNRIKQRNKTIKRKVLLKDGLESKPKDEKQEQKVEKTSWFSWPKFTFPVLRKRSLKYRSVHNGQTPNFVTRHEFLKFLQMSNYNQVVGSSLPHKMKMWNYTQPLHPHPLLHWHVEEFGKKDYVAKSINLHSRTNSVSVIDVLYQNYKTRAFEVAKRKHSRNRSGVDYMKVPPPFQKLYPQDAILLCKREVHQINTKLLVEVLLRRTVAAKMEYRLKQHGVDLGTANHSSSLSFSSSSSSLSHSDNNQPPQRGNQGGESSKQRSNSPGSRTYHNDNLILQNETIFKDIISGSSDQSPKDRSGKIYFQLQSNSSISSNRLFFTNPFTLDPKTNSLAKGLNEPRQKPMYQLTPQQHRSHSTLSSEDKTFESFSSSEYENSSPRVQGIDSFRDSFSTLSRDKVRKSESTTNTSILHYLDHLSLEVGSVLEELDPEHDGISTKVVRKDLLPTSTSTMKLGSRRTVPKNIVEPAGIIEKLNEYDLRVI